MPDTRCGQEHPDDYGPIQRRCGRQLGHDGLHEFHGFAGFGKPHSVDRWDAT